MIMVQTTYRNPKNALTDKGEKVRGENYFAMVPLPMASAGLNGATWDVYITLDGMQGNKDHCWPSIENLCKRTNQSSMSVKRAVSKLEKLGVLLVIRRRGRGNLYFVINGSRRPGEEIDHFERTVEKKPRKNNLNSQVGSKKSLKVGSNMTISKPNFETVITSRNRSSLIKSIESDKSPKTPLRRIQEKKVTGFMNDFGVVPE